MTTNDPPQQLARPSSSTRNGGRVISSTTTRKVIRTKTVIKRVRPRNDLDDGTATISSVSTTTTTNVDSDSPSSLPIDLPNVLQSVWVRIFTIELPILSFLLVLLVLLQTSLYVHTVFLHPYLRSLEWTEERRVNERTYPSFDCANDPNAITLQSPDDLFLDSATRTTQYATEFVMQHGGAVFADLIDPTDAAELRKYLLHQHGSPSRSSSSTLPVLMNANRHSVGLTALEHSSIPRVLHSIASNQFLRDTLESLLGPNPAILALSTIIAYPGAEHQNYHVDKPPDGSSMQFAHSFLPNYALLIPLQDTTQDMGATAICPGTHRCDAMNRTFAEQEGFPVVDSSAEGVWKAGFGLLYHGQVRHRGSAHVGGADGEARVVLILTFGSRPVSHNMTSHNGRRMLPLLPHFALRWDMWGFTLNDMLDANKYMRYPWLRSWGLWKHTEAEWGWTAIEDICALVADRHYARRGASAMRYLQKKWWWWLTSVLFPLENLEAWQETNIPGALFEFFLVEYVRRLRTLVVLLLVAFSAGYFWIIVHLSKQTSVRGCVVRLCSIAVLASMLALFGVSQLNSSEFWRNMATGRVNDVPSIRLPTLLENQTLIDRPVFQDVLLSPLLSNAAPLYAYAQMLDYHEGNRQWRAIAARSVDKFVEQTKSQEKVLKQIIDETEAKDAEARRFLTQVKGGWVEMTSTEVMQATRDLLIKTKQTCHEKIKP